MQFLAITNQRLIFHPDPFGKPDRSFKSDEEIPRKTTGRFIGSGASWSGGLGADHRSIQRCLPRVVLKHLLNDTVKVRDNALGYSGLVVQQYANTQVFCGKNRNFIVEMVNTSPMVP